MDIPPTTVVQKDGTFITEDSNYAHVTESNKSIIYISELGAGGYGKVHQIYDKEKKQFFARKLVTLSPPLNRSLNNEIRALQKLCVDNKHENLVSVYDYDIHTSGLYYKIDMEVCAVTLKEFINDPKSVPRAVHKCCLYCGNNSDLDNHSLRFEIMIQVSSGVSFNHQHNEVHRDLKPSNILFSLKDCLWKITDFGFTSELFGSYSASSVSGRGTPSYRAPELFAGTPRYSKKTDIWALGCILYELLFTKKLFEGDGSVLFYLCSQEAIEMPDLPALDDCTKNALSKVMVQTLDRVSRKRPSAPLLQRTFIELSAKRQSILSTPPSNEIDTVFDGMAAIESDIYSTGSTSEIGITQSGRFICECGISTTRKHDLKRHIQGIHDKSFEYLCMFRNCGKAFVRKDALNRHILVRHYPHLVQKAEMMNETVNSGSRKKLRSRRSWN